MKTILVTGGAGFIGSAFVRRVVPSGVRVINVDKLTYSANLANLSSVAGAANHRLVIGDILDQELILSLMREERVEAIVHLAAESHVDRAINDPAPFIETNVVGTFRLLEAALEYWRGMDQEKRARFRFHHISTDEVFGELPLDGSRFDEETPYAPSSPYSASKAASDHLVRAWHRTYGLPVVLSNCSNNFGPYQFPEKLIPLSILSALQEKEIGVYGTGDNIRDWLYVEDHARALERVLAAGKIGESYNIGGSQERTNLQVVQSICDFLDERLGLANGQKRRELIAFVPDRPGHDRRYAINSAKAERDLQWSPIESFESGLAKTIDWYLNNRSWWEPLGRGKT